jgi:PAS domain S-box-containing protein
MLPSPFEAVIGLVGILVELGACFLITGLVLGLRREARHRDYVAVWSRAWIAISVAISAVALRYHVIPFVDPATDPNGPLVAVLYAIYQVSKLLFFAFLVLGIVVLARGQPSTKRERRWAVAAATILGLASVLVTRDLNNLVLAQAGLAVPVFGISIWRLRRLPPSRRSRGTTFLAVALFLLGVQWLLYLQGFAVADQPAGTRWMELLQIITRFNSFFDSGELLFLGIGMALTLVEDNHRETEQNQLDRVREANLARERLGEILRSAHEGIVTLGPDRSIDLMNPAAASILGVELSGIQGQSFDQFLQARQREPLWSGLEVATRRSVANPPVAVRREVVGIRGSGDELPLELSVSSFGEGDARGWVVVLRDLTDQINEREEHERLQAQLAQTARLEAIGRMVSGVAHELNNPLTAIMAFSQDLAATAKSAEDREALTVIAQQAERCRVIVGDLLIFARSRREERTRVEPADLVSRVARVFERESARYRVDFAVNVSRDLPPIEVDAPGMEQVLTNLLTNAFQASPAGGRVTLTVTAADGRVRFDVDDAGVGVAPELTARVFEPFFTTKAPGEGTGLGLSVSHAIVSQHGGTITVENVSPIGGARFRVEIPLADRSPVPIGSAVASISSEPPPGRVLIVDDEPAIRVAIRRSLERRGWLVDEAGDGDEAWEKLDRSDQSREYDVVVTDLRMPGTSGIELVDRVRASYPGLADRIIVITGDTASPAVAEFLARLTTPHLQKPFDLRSLVRLVEQVRGGVQA